MKIPHSYVFGRDWHCQVHDARANVSNQNRCRTWTLGQPVAVITEPL